MSPGTARDLHHELGATAVEESLGDDLPLLHIVTRAGWPIALCGALVRDDFNPHRTDTAGRDRCTECLAELAKRRSSSHG